MNRFFRLIVLTCLFSMFFAVSPSAQDIDFIADEPESVISTSSCEQGGEIWVCSKTEAVKAFDQFHANCTESKYPCGGKLLKTIRDLCTPGGLVLKISSKPCGQ